MAGTINTGYAAGTSYNNMRNPSVSGREKADTSFSDTMSEKCGVPSRDMTLTEYKLYFHDKVKSLYTHPSQRHVDWFIDITDAAYRRMQADPLYEKQVLDYLAREKAASWYGHEPKFIYVHIDDTMEKSYGYAFGLQDDSRAKRAAERRRMAAEQAKKERRKKLLKQYLKKKAEAKRLQDQLLKNQLTKHRLEHIRLEQARLKQIRFTQEWQTKRETAQILKQQAETQKQEQAQAAKGWSEERQAVQAFNAYEASFIMMGRSENQLLS